MLTDIVRGVVELYEATFLISETKENYGCSQDQPFLGVY